MKEIENIVRLLETLDWEQRVAALVTVVRVRGSSYRNPGARMLILDNGRWTGSISGGCLEGDAMRKAREVMRTGVPRLVTYDTMDDHSNDLRIGLGCNGIIDVLLEPVNAHNNPLEYLKPISGIQAPCASAVVFQTTSPQLKIGERTTLFSGGQSNNSSSTPLAALISDEMQLALDSGQSRICTNELNDGEFEVLIEVIQPPIELVIFGAGPDAQPLAHLAKALGWKVTVSDECIAHTSPVNFPGTDQVINCQREYVHQEVNLTPFSAVVIMSHNFDYDLAVLAQIIHAPCSYIGVMGPKSRMDKLMAQLEKKQVTITTKALSRIHAPIGLDIGADSPDEIALSILSEILARFAGRSAGFLKYHSGPIHKREGIDNQVFKQMYLSPSDSDQSQTGS